MTGIIVLNHISTNHRIIVYQKGIFLSLNRTQVLAKKDTLVITEKTARRRIRRWVAASPKVWANARTALPRVLFVGSGARCVMPKFFFCKKIKQNFHQWFIGNY
jgi:hypothetical protein